MADPQGLSLMGEQMTVLQTRPGGAADIVVAAEPPSMLSRSGITKPIQVHEPQFRYRFEEF